MGRIFTTVNMLQFQFKIGKPWPKLRTKPTENSKIDFIDTLHVTCDNHGVNEGSVAIPNIEKRITFRIVSAYNFRLYRSIVR